MSGIFKSVANLFAPAPVQNNTPANAAANPTTPGSTEARSDGSVAAIPPAGTGDKSPLENYKNLWDAPANPVAEPSLVPAMNVDPAAIRNVASTVNFVGTIDPALLARAGKGDNEALASVINQAVQAGYASSAGATAKIVEDALRKQETIFNEKVMPSVLRKHEISQRIATDNPMFSNPAAAPLIEGLKTQLQAKYPTATPEQISQHAQQYLTGFMGEYAASSGQQLSAIPKQSPSDKSDDWTKYFGVAADF